jgi:hypothetical protein
MDEILRSHVIDPSAMRTDNFDHFFLARSQALLERIEEAMGKPIARGVVETEEVTEPLDYEVEEAEEPEAVEVA